MSKIKDFVALHWKKIVAVIVLVVVIIISTTVAVVATSAPSEATVGRLAADIEGPGFEPNHAVDKIVFYGKRFYFISVLPNTQDLVVLEVIFTFGSTNFEIEQSISRVLRNGAGRARDTQAQIEQIYQDASVVTAKYYGDLYVLKNIRMTKAP